MNVHKGVGTKGVGTKTDYAYAELRRRLLTGEFAPGGVIGQASLATELGVSTTPLREALRRLEADGLVQLSAHRDARVMPLTAEEARSLYEMRLQLDPFAAALAAERRTTTDVANIAIALERLEPLQEDTDLAGLEAHRAFHRAIHEASHSPLLVETLDRLWDKADRYRIVGLRAEPSRRPEDAERIAREHREIGEAVMARDTTSAERVMRQHVEHSHGRRVLERLGSLGEGSALDTRRYNE